jgi:hypothetical protein
MPKLGIGKDPTPPCRNPRVRNARSVDEEEARAASRYVRWQALPLGNRDMIILILARH